MLPTDLVERAHDGTLEQAPHAFNAVRVHVTDHPFVHGVVDGLVHCVFVTDAAIGQKLVSVDSLRFVLYGALDEVVERGLAGVLDMLKSDPSVTAIWEQLELTLLIHHHSFPAPPLVRGQVAARE